MSFTEPVTAPVTEPVTAPVTEPVVAPVTEPVVTDPAATKVETFDREYVESLRRENATHRTRAKDFEDAFQGYSPEQQKTLLGMVRGLADPGSQKATAAELKAIAEAIMAADEPVTPTGEADPLNAPLTRREFEELQQRQKDEQRQTDAIAAIERDATTLGFPPLNPDGTDNMRYSMLLHAVQQPGIEGDLAKAAEAVKAHDQAIIDQYAKSVAEGGQKWPPTAGTAPNTGPQQQPTERPTFKGARKALESWLDAHPGDT